MKTYILILILLISRAYSQIHTAVISYVDSSENQKYFAKTTGHHYEGFAADQKIQLFNYNSDTLWTKIVNSHGLRLPAVSNTGVTAIIYERSIFFYNRYDSLIWQYDTRPDYLTYTEMSRDDIYINTYSDFSPDSRLFFIFILDKIKRNNHLYCLEIGVGERWNLDYDYYKTRFLQIVESNILIHDFNLIQRNYTNSACLVDFKGNILKKFSKDIRRMNDF